MWLKISIIVPSFNQGNFIEQCLQSLIHQNYPNLEIIVIDGHSTDHTISIIKKYESYIHYWESEPDKGQAHAINKGLLKATGDVVAWLNSDDLYFPDTLEKVAKIFLNNPDVMLIHGRVENFYHNGKNSYIHLNTFSPYSFIKRVSIHQPGVFWKRELHQQIGYLDNTLHYLMDYDLWFRIFFSYSTQYVPEVLAKFRIHEKSKTSNNPMGLYLEYRKILSRFFNSFEDQSIINKLKKLNIYDNPDDKKYNLQNFPLPLQKALNIYTHECALQEYTWGNIKKSNILFLSSFFEDNVLKNILYLIKNNLGIKYLMR